MKHKNLIKIISTIFIIVPFLFLYSCSPSKRLQRLIKNHPELIDSISIKTKPISIKDSIRISYRTDTNEYKVYDSVLIEIEKLLPKDSIVIRKINKLKTLYHYKTLYLNLDTCIYKENVSVCIKADSTGYIKYTIFKKSETIKATTIVKTKDTDYYIWLLLFFGGLIVGLLVKQHSK
jgi:hypothetical protein